MVICFPIPYIQSFLEGLISRLVDWLIIYIILIHFISYIKLLIWWRRSHPRPLPSGPQAKLSYALVLPDYGSMSRPVIKLKRCWTGKKMPKNVKDTWKRLENHHRTTILETRFDLFWGCYRWSRACGYLYIYIHTYIYIIVGWIYQYLGGGTLQVHWMINKIWGAVSLRLVKNHSKPYIM